MKKFFPIFTLFLNVALFVIPSWCASLSNSWWGFIPLLFFFFGFSAGAWSWGRLIALPFGGGALGIWLSATAFYSIVGALLGHLGVLQTLAPIVYPALAISGILLNFSFWSTLPLKIRWPRGAALILLVVFVALGVRAFSSFLPHGHGDPLYYHLLGPRLWVQHGGVYVEPLLPNAFLASVWEFLYLGPQVIFRNLGLSGLIAAQAFCQWIHLFWGWAGVGLALYFIFRELGFGLASCAFAAIASPFANSIQWTAGLAKNDMGIAFWGLGGIYYLLTDLNKKYLPSRNLWFGGFFIGMATAGKVNAIFLIGPFVGLWAIYLIWHSRGKAIRPIFLVGFAAMLPIVPTVLRSFVFTGSPLYPLFGNLFPSPWLSQSAFDSISNLSPIPNVDRLALASWRWKSFLKESPFIFGWLALPFLFWGGRNSEKSIERAILVLAASMALLVFSISFGPIVESRHLGASLALFTGIGALEIAEAAQRWKWKSQSMVALWILLLACSHLPLHLLWRAHRISPGLAFLEGHTASDSKDWIRNNVSPETPVVISGDNEMYYFPSNSVLTLEEDPFTDRATYGISDPKEYIRKVCESSQSGILLAARSSLGFGIKFPELVSQAPALFRGNSSVVFSLAELQKFLSAEVTCPLPQLKIHGA